MSSDEGAESTRSARAESSVKPDDLLIHPDDERGGDHPHPFGIPGPPMSTRAPFYVGFTGTLGVLFAIVVGLAIREVTSVLILVLVAAFIAVGLNPLVEWLMHSGVRRPLAVATVSAFVLGGMALFIVALVPVLRDQVTALIDNVPAWLDDLRHESWVQDLDNKYDVIAKAKAKVQDLDLATTAFGGLFAVGLAVLNALFNAFLVFVLTLYFLSALPSLKRACYSLAPASRRTRVTLLGDEILRSVGGYVVGVFVVASFAGVSSFIFLEIVGLSRYAVALALVVFITDFVPLIGATIGATIVSLIGFAVSWQTGLICVIFYVIYQQAENYFIYPRVMRRNVDVPGVVTVIAVLIGGSLLGVVGAMLAIPTAAAALLLIREVFLQRQDAR